MFRALLCSKHVEAYNNKIILIVSAMVSVVKAQDASLQWSEVAQDS